MRNSSRRRFLQAAGLSGAMLPLLSRVGGAQVVSAPKRLVIMCWSNGVRRNDYWPELGPTGGETDWTLPVIGSAPAGHSKVALPILEPLVKEFRNDMLLVGGMDLNAFFDARRPNYEETPRAGNAHDDMSALLTGAHMAQYKFGFASAGGESIEQFIGKQLATQEGLAFNSLVVGAKAGSGWQGTISYAGYDDPGITPENDPEALFRTLFEGRNLPKGEFDKLSATRKSILDLLGKDLQRFGSRLGTEDKRKIDAHLAAIRELERQINTQSAVECAAPSAPNSDLGANDEYPARVKTQLDLIATALKCDLTRCVTFNFENTGGNDLVFSWLGQEFTGAGDEYPTRQHHDIAHNFFRSELGAYRHSRVNQWFMEQVAYLARLLKSTPEGEGTMLDNTAIVVLNSMGQNHSAYGVPCVIVGSCGGALRTGGRVVRFGEWATQADRAFYWGQGELGWLNGEQVDFYPGHVTGVPHNGLLVALANAMGTPVPTFGEAEYGGTLSSLLV